MPIYMIVPFLLYYEDYYKPKIDVPSNHPMDMNMLFHVRGNLKNDIEYAFNTISNKYPREEEGEVLDDGIFMNDDPPFDLSHV